MNSEKLESKMFIVLKGEKSPLWSEHQVSTTTTMKAVASVISFYVIIITTIAILPHICSILHLKKCFAHIISVKHTLNSVIIIFSLKLYYIKTGYDEFAFVIHNWIGSFIHGLSLPRMPPKGFHLRKYFSETFFGNSKLG